MAATGKTKKAQRAAGSLDLVLSTFRAQKGPKDLRNMLCDLATPREIADFAERLTIFRMLNSGLTQRVVADRLGISVTTVNRGARMIKSGTGFAKKFK